jgi:hypothetical protein
MTRPGTAQVGMMVLTLTTHAIAGAAIACVMPVHPYLAISSAFASHFLLDAIPHWDYPIRSDAVKPGICAAIKFDGALLADVLAISADALLGLSLALVLLARSNNFLVVFCAAGAAIFPDALQFAYKTFPREPLISLQGFHSWIHSKRDLRTLPVLGLATQIGLIFFVVLIVRTFASS